ncbi:MAG: phosphatase PAP2 family protein [Patescibacteria group bacterium]|nr:phosphatase PAP2 family protein [Patescibacteria group bacterium]
MSHRAGPSIILSFTPLISSGANSVFPSGYMAFLVPLGLAVWQFSRKKGVWFMGLTFVAGVFMVVAGVNWPGDIVVGMIVGVVSFTLIRLFFREQASTPAFTSKDSLLA